MSNHHRSPYLVGKFLQNNNQKFIGNSFCKSGFILYKRLWIFFASMLSHCHRKTTDNNSTLVLHNLDAFTKLFFDQFTLSNFQPFNREI